MRMKLSDLEKESYTLEAESVADENLLERKDLSPEIRKSVMERIFRRIDKYLSLIMIIKTGQIDYDRKKVK